MQQYWSRPGQEHQYLSCGEMSAAFQKSQMGADSYGLLQQPFQETEGSNQVHFFNFQPAHHNLQNGLGSHDSDSELEVSRVWRGVRGSPSRP